MRKRLALTSATITAAFLLAIGSPLAANAAIITLGSLTCGQAWGPYVHISSDASGDTISHTHRVSALVANTATWSNPTRQYRLSSFNRTAEDGSYIYLSANANLRGSGFFCDN